MEESGRLGMSLLKVSGLSSICLALVASCFAQNASRPSPTNGIRTGTVTIVEFADFECPYCAQQAPVIRTLQAEYRGRLVIVFKHFPLPSHPDARVAHRAAVAAAEQGRFWEMYDLLFRGAGHTSAQDIDRYVQQLGLNREAFRRSMQSVSTEEAIERDIADGKKLGLKGTPVLVVNGREFVGFQDYETLKSVIEELNSRQAKDKPLGQ